MTPTACWEDTIKPSYPCLIQWETAMRRAILVTPSFLRLENIACEVGNRYLQAVASAAGERRSRDDRRLGPTLGYWKPSERFEMSKHEDAI